jgi:MoaA/NifB/PqqE/SkfB family radical SAM enzyme
MRFRRLARLPVKAALSAYGVGGPFKATLAATYVCPHRCTYCGIFRRREAELPARAIIDAFAGLDSLVWLDLTGGEPLAREDCEELACGLARALPNLALFHFPTSGAYPDRAVALARTVSRLGLRVVVTVSIEGAEALHDRVRGRPGAFASAVETLRRLRELPGVAVYVGTTLIGANVELVPGGVFEAVSREVPGLSRADMHFNVAQVSGHYFCNAEERRPSPRQVAEALERILLFKGFRPTPFSLLEAGFQLFALAAARAGARAGAGAVPPCSALRSSFFFSPSGTVYPCHIWGEPVGAVGAGMRVADLLAGQPWAWVRQAVARRSCPRCWTPCEAYPSMISAAVNPLGFYTESR